MFVLTSNNKDQFNNNKHEIKNSFKKPIYHEIEVDVTKNYDIEITKNHEIDVEITKNKWSNNSRLDFKTDGNVPPVLHAYVNALHNSVDGKIPLIYADSAWGPDLDNRHAYDFK